jgi:hypothetical protein
MSKIFFLYLSTVFFFCHSYSGERGFFAEGAVFYWRASESGLSYAAKSSSEHKLAPDGKVENLKFEWDFGFKVGLGYRLPHDDWELKLQFTSFQTHTDNEKKARDGDVLFPLWQSVGEGPFFAEGAKVHWRLHLGIVDLMLSKFYPVTKSLFLTPQIGIRGGSVRQKYNLEYSGGSFATTGNEIIHMKNKYFGIGPNVALFGQYAFGRNFSLFAKGAFSLLFGEFYLHQDEYTSNGKNKQLGVHDIFCSSRAVFETTAGIRWECFFQRALKRLELEIAWDEFLFFSQNQLLHFPSSAAQGVFFANQGDLFVSGITFNIHFDF